MLPLWPQILPYAHTSVDMAGDSQVVRSQHELHSSASLQHLPARPCHRPSAKLTGNELQSRAAQKRTLGNTTGTEIVERG